jgi:type III secretion system FlhB-like substrate exporter
MIADWDYHLSTESGWSFPSRGMTGPQDPIGKAVADVWAKNRDVTTDADDNKTLPCLISRNRGFDLQCPVPSPASNHDVTFTFAVPNGWFALAGYPVVTLADPQRTRCDHAWSRRADGTWACVVRAPAAEAGAFRFALDDDLPAAFSLPSHNIEAVLTLKDIGIAPATGARPAPQKIAYMTTPAYAALLDDIKTNGVDRLAATATNSTWAPIRLFAANACVARRRGDTVALALPLYEASLGKMQEFGVAWADQIQPLVRGLLNAGAPNALAWAREQFEAAGLDGNATREAVAFGNLIEATLKAEGADAARKLVEDRAAAMPADAAAAFQLRRTAAPLFAANGQTDQAIEILRQAMADRRIDERVRRPFVEKTLVALVAGAKTTFPANRYVALWREFDDDFVGKANGRSLAVAEWRWFLERQLGSAYGDRYEFEPMAAIYDAWIDWDGDQLPVGFRAERQGIAIGYFRNRLKGLEGKLTGYENQVKQRPADAGIAAEFANAGAAVEFLKQELGRRVPAWHATLRDTEKNGHNEETRNQAYTTLMNDAWDNMNHQQRVDALARIVDNKFNAHGTRRDAAKRMANLHITNDGTNWSAVAESVVRNIGAGDWSSNDRNTYRQKRTTDIRLDYAVEYAEKLIAAGQGTVAKSMLERAAPLLGYYAGTTAADEPGTREADMSDRLKRIDEVMAKCGAARPPRPLR